MADLLPEDELLKLAIEAKQTSLSIENQKELASIILDSVRNDTHHQEDKISKCKALTVLSRFDTQTNFYIVIDNKPTELTAFGNVLLRSSKCKFFFI